MARSKMSDGLEGRLIEMMRASPKVMEVLTHIRDADLPDWRLVSGAVYGTVWNSLTGREPDYGIKDYDICYFDPDTSWEAEDVVIKAVERALPDTLKPLVEVRNQARVHLWFEGRFGSPYAPLTCTDEALERYLCFSDAVGIRLEADDTISIAAPFGLEDVFAMVLRPNPKRGPTNNTHAKVASIQARWPEVQFKEA
jgi:hypothetical protein